MRVGQWLGKSPWCKPSEGWRQEMQRLDRQQSEALAARVMSQSLWDGCSVQHYPLVNIQKTLKMVIFHSYVSLPEDKYRVAIAR